MITCCPGVSVRLDSFYWLVVDRQSEDAGKSVMEVNNQLLCFEIKFGLEVCQKIISTPKCGVI